jgi:hypothetical protein
VTAEPFPRVAPFGEGGETVVAYVLERAALPDLCVAGGADVVAELAGHAAASKVFGVVGTGQESMPGEKPAVVRS